MSESILLQGGAVVARLAHNQKVTGAIPVPATNLTASVTLDTSFTGFLSCICSWCKLVMSDVPCDLKDDGKVTHGICQDCSIKQMEPELCERIGRADATALREIYLIEVPLVDDAEDRVALKNLIQKRLNKLNGF